MGEMKIGSSTILFLISAAGVNQIRAKSPGLTDIETIILTPNRLSPGRKLSSLPR